MMAVTPIDITIRGRTGQPTDQPCVKEKGAKIITSKIKT